MHLGMCPPPPTGAIMYEGYVVEISSDNIHFKSANPNDILIFLGPCIEIPALLLTAAMVLV